MNNAGKLWAPWRMEYLETERPPGCIFCRKPEEKEDRENLILHRGARVFVILNRYPYTNGHLLVVPYLHTAHFEDMDSSTAMEIFRLQQHCLNFLQTVMKPEGFNIGLNLGKVAGAGIHDHIHYHIVPRWMGDTNYLPVLSGTRVISEHLFDTYDKLFPLFDALERETPSPEEQA